MLDTAHLNLALKHGHTAAYAYLPDSGQMQWSGDLLSLIPFASQEHIASLDGWLGHVANGEKNRVLAAYQQAVNGTRSLREQYILHVNGHDYTISDTANVGELQGKPCLLGTVTVTTPEATNYAPLPAAPYDNLRAEFVQHVHALFARYKDGKETACILKVSLNNIHTILSWHGSAVADKVLADIISHISKFLPKDHIIQRISIDKIGIIIHNATRDMVQQFINKTHHYVREYRGKDFEEPLRINLSIGSVYAPSHAKNTTEAMERLYIALANARESSPGFYCDYIDAQSEQKFSKEQINVMYYMKDAVHQDKFMLAFQPIVESKTGKVASYECLLRLKDDEGKISTAWPVIHMAEKTGFIDVVDQFVLEKVVEELRANPDITLTFNVSNMTTDSPKWLANCTKYFSDPDIASRAIIEITETAAERDLKQTAYFVASLQALGCRVALDDFGAGYTSFRQLKSLSVDMVKIDGMFILDLAENSENLLFIKTLMDFNNCYGLQTIAECVESGEVAKLLMDLNVEYMQGYYFGVPIISPPWRKK